MGYEQSEHSISFRRTLSVSPPNLCAREQQISTAADELSHMSTFGESAFGSSTVQDTSISTPILLAVIPVAISEISQMMDDIRDKMNTRVSGITSMHDSTTSGGEFTGTTGNRSHRHDLQASPAPRHVSPIGNLKYLLTSCLDSSLEPCGRLSM